MIYLLIFCIIIILCVIYSLVLVYSYGKRYILNINSVPNKCDTVIVLGAGVRPDGNPCDLLADRLEIGARAYLNEKSKSILLTGDNSGEHYNEVGVMKNWIINNHGDNINEEKILLDNKGFCTYDSMIRAKEVFNIKKAVISTNKYHLPRSIYIARRLGIEAYGIPSDLREYDRMKKYKKREVLAQLKDFYLVNWYKVKLMFKR